MKSAFAIHKENAKKTPMTFKVKLKATGKVRKAKKTQKKAAPKSKPTKKVVASKTKKSSASMSKQSATKSPKTPGGKQSPIRKQSPKATSPTSKKASGKQKNVNQKTSAKSAKDTKVVKKAQTKNESQKKPTKRSSSASKSTSDDNEKIQTKKSPSSAKMKSPKVTPSKDNTSKPASAAKKGSQKKSPTKHSSPPLPAGEKTPPAKNTPTSSKKKKKSPVQKVQKGETKKTTENGSEESLTSSKEIIPQKYPPSTPKTKSSLSNSVLDLTPVSELKATEEASRDSMMVKIIPLKPHGDSGSSTSTRKRKNAATNSKNSKKLKIKLMPRKVPAKTNSSSPKNGESPRIVNSSTTPNGLPGTNGPNTVTDSGTESALLFEWLIAPVTPQNFFDNLWEKKPLLVRRHKPQYFQGLFTTDEFHNILKQNDIQFGKHLDITTYTDGKRETHNPEGRAHAPVVWDYFNNGCSVRLLNPQTYSAKVWKLLSTLQEHFGSFCGANVYLTPADTQGFAPHYDDIEAFILQLEGRKRWRLYSPRSDNEMLPRTSSENFTDAEIGVPILDTVLEEGDVLYFPRGFIHQATPPSDTHSLHLTVSTYQKNTWGDLLEKLCESALQTAMEEDLTFRQSLPRDYLNFMGVMNSDLEDDRRTAFISKIGELFTKLASYAPADLAADQLGMNLIHSSLPPVLTDEEMSCMIHATKVRFVNGEFVTDSKLLSEDTEIQLIRRGVLRLIITQENEIQVHHCTENSRVYHEKPCQYFVIPPESAPGVEFLIRQYPKFVTVDQLPLEGDLKGKEVELANLLFEKGLIRTKHPLDTDTENER